MSPLKTSITTLIITTLFFIGCTKKIETKKHMYTNDLIHETSPYLLQHAHNPVDWNAWNNEALGRAKKENKLIIISIGYAACHWCHVMEQESFEDSLVAKTMNTHFINIKVDREERPDVDNVYMSAVQLMTGSGGWPLNVIALPDGRPIWGGTYFPKKQWQSALNQITQGFKDNPQDFYTYADKLEEGIKSVGLIRLNTEKANFTKNYLEEELKKWRTLFDESFGGMNRSPKFMMPNNYRFLLRYAYQNNDKPLMEHVQKTLDKMAFGGIFDQLNGGFSRYAVDRRWHIPHFEKMLYDNAQLVSLYTDAYQITKNETYKNVVFETLEFVQNELTSPEGAFYSSLDADSYNQKDILEEGAYYSWTKEKLKYLLKSDFELFSKYYNVNKYGSWEDDKFVLIKTVNDFLFSEENKISVLELNKSKKRWKKILNNELIKRKKPRLDDKSLTSWNALMLEGYLDAYTVFKKKEYLAIALKNAAFLVKNQLTEKGRLYHNYKGGKSTINGYLEDYATTAAAFIKLYQTTSDEQWLQRANDLIIYSIDNFYNKASKMFYFTSRKDPSLVAKTIEYQDDVIPSSNSIMAKNLFYLSHYFNNNSYKEMAISMLNNVTPVLTGNGSSFSNWLDLMLNYTNPFYEVVVVGKNASKKIETLYNNYLPNILISYSETDKDLPLLKNRFVQGETFIYVCINNSCKLPVKTIQKTLKLIRR